MPVTVLLKSVETKDALHRTEGIDLGLLRKFDVGLLELLDIVDHTEAQSTENLCNEDVPPLLNRKT